MACLGENVPCRRCGYNLRSLSLARNCPECSLPIELSMKGDLLQAANPDWLRWLIVGAWIIFVGTVLGRSVSLLLRYWPGFPATGFFITISPGG